MTYSILLGTRIVAVFEHLEHARAFARGIYGHTVTLWDSENRYYGTWHWKEGWIH